MSSFELNNKIKLADGRDLGYSVFGAVHGKPFLYFHGLPGSRLEGQLLHQAAIEFDIKIIAVDRPGYGFSSLQLGRTLKSWVLDILVLLEVLEHPRVGVIGVSGGGPCALACAHEMPEKIDRIGVVCGLAPIYLTGLANDMRWFPRLGFYLGQKRPRLLNLGIAKPLQLMAKVAPDLCISMLAKVNTDTDRLALRRPAVKALLAKSLQQALSASSAGAEYEVALYANYWGFELERIEKKILLWHGDADRVVPLSHGRYMHKHLPQSELIVVPGAGHFSLPILHTKEILSALRDA